MLDLRSHGILDYATVLVFALAPSIVGFGGLPATICYLLAAVHLLLTLVTAFPLGAAAWVPPSVHGAIELVVSIVLVALPWILGFAAERGARWFYVAIGGVIFVVWLVTRYRTAAAA